jgi:hypothetical protein
MGLLSGSQYACEESKVLKHLEIGQRWVCYREANENSLVLMLVVLWKQRKRVVILDTISAKVLRESFLRVRENYAYKEIASW